MTVNYSTSTLKYIPHARQTTIQKSQRAKTKDTNKRVFSSLQVCWAHNCLALVSPIIIVLFQDIGKLKKKWGKDDVLNIFILKFSSIENDNSNERRNSFVTSVE